eukprot:TRINITY_DN15329_c0_g1_i3.p1 TRINITY_DN15329_c0_g1~~TRINITY_DN15329_c0_g1_i3.p1  ORF type:complete len:624 (+),score=176.32 TRINITY_DN15329_c0_g1_i3:91-1962(+)
MSAEDAAIPWSEVQRRFAAMQERVHELEGRLRRREEQLASEKERNDRARRKLRQLFAKVQDRDAIIVDLKAQVAAAHGMHAASRQAAGGCRRELGASSKAALHNGGNFQTLSQKTLADRERMDIVEQLEKHLEQMRLNLAEGEGELRVLLERKRVKEIECDGSDNHAQLQTLELLKQQIQEKRSFNKELGKKMTGLEVQVKQQCALLEGTTDADACRAAAEEDRRKLPSGSVSSAVEGEGADGDEAPDEAPDDEALQAFLSAAGPAADVIMCRPALRAAFEERPLQLSGGAVEGCSAQERTQAMSLFAAWNAVASTALRMSDISLCLEDLAELHDTLHSCGAQLEEVELSRCPVHEAKKGGKSPRGAGGLLQCTNKLFTALASQPLRLLNLGYNALGPTGVTSLVEVADTWRGTLTELSLEMNGIGNNGCIKLAQALADGLLPSLTVLELGWNELSADCATALAKLLSNSEARQSSSGKSRPTLQRLALGGNRLGSEGGLTLVTAAMERAVAEQSLEPLQEPCLDVDLSMNHIAGGGAIMRALAAWAEDKQHAGKKLAVSICMEWNMLDDQGSVKRLSKALAKAGIFPADDACTPLLRLANNDDLTELDPQNIFEESNGLISC